MKSKIFKYLFIIVILISFMTISGCTKEAVQEPEIPENFTTFTDEQGLFSISYPPNWETALSPSPEFEQTLKYIVSSIKLGMPVGQALLFTAGIPVEAGYAPIVMVGIDPVSADVNTQEQMLESQITAINQSLSDYHEFSRIKTTVGGREATIIEWEGTYPGIGKNHNLQMYMLVGRNAWVVSCTPPLGEYDKWDKDFQAIVRSLRIFI